MLTRDGYSSDLRRSIARVKNSSQLFKRMRLSTRDPRTWNWNSHVPTSVLHDFEEMRVLDCRYKPDIQYCARGCDPEISLHGLRERAIFY